MTLVLTLLILQGLLGAADTLIHHELGAALPDRPGARRELALHALREAIYAVIFLTLPWLDWQGALAAALLALLLIELVITLTDFIEEDRTRRLAASERVLHTIMAIGFGVLLMALAPVLLAWSERPTGFAPEGHGLLSWAASAIGLGVLAWAIRDSLACLGFTPPTPRPGVRPSGLTVLVTGATGFIGRALVERLNARGDRVIVLVRDLLAGRSQFGDRALVVDTLDLIGSEARLDAVVNLAGAPVIAGPWTKGRRRVLLGSRLAVTGAVLGLIERLQHKPAVLVSASATGFYGDRGQDELDEVSAPRPGFMSELCRRWEEEAWLAEAWGVRVCRLRLGMVFASGGGPLPMLSLPVRFGLGAVLGSGRQWAPWIHLQDSLDLIERALDDPRYEGPINAVAPEAVTHEAMTKAIAGTLRRPLFLRVPAAPMRLALGEMSDLFLASQKVAPARAQALGFEFRYPTLGEALNEALGDGKRRPAAVNGPVPEHRGALTSAA